MNPNALAVSHVRKNKKTKNGGSHLCLKHCCRRIFRVLGGSPWHSTSRRSIHAAFGCSYQCFDQREVSILSRKDERSLTTSVAALNVGLRNKKSSSGTSCPTDTRLKRVEQRAVSNSQGPPSKQCARPCFCTPSAPSPLPAAAPNQSSKKCKYRLQT